MYYLIFTVDILIFLYYIQYMKFNTYPIHISPITHVNTDKT